ncbi:spore coat protein U domain-containing protein [Aquicoccus porphyridii]|uniref:spore coat protein U domain-containing protein n=1 Tax=Aquicoccus porphyridii TaxID=1852029 RepID=UPI00273DEEBD|nr:spore coat protein U domain-containing protein [Aquicoccus porphyridii]
MKKLSALSAVLGALGTFAIPAFAAVEEGTLNITATVIAQCTVTTTAVAFGDISPTQAATATGAISISCDDNNTLDSVVVGGGGNEDAGARRMSDGGTNFIPYTLSIGGSAVAVNGDIASEITLTGAGPYTDSVDVDGAIASTGTARTVGSYSDAVTITVNYSAP